VLLSKISAWEAKSKASYWNNTPGQRKAKLFIKYSKKRASELNKKDLRTLVDLYTGHCPLNTTYISWAKQATQPVASAREQMKRRNTYYVHAILSPSKGYYT